MAAPLRRRSRDDRPADRPSVDSREPSSASCPTRSSFPAPANCGCRSTSRRSVARRGLRVFGVLRPGATFDGCDHGVESAFRARCRRPDRGMTPLRLRACWWSASPRDSDDTTLVMSALVFVAGAAAARGREQRCDPGVRPHLVAGAGTGRANRARCRTKPRRRPAVLRNAGARLARRRDRAGGRIGRARLHQGFARGLALLDHARAESPYRGVRGVPDAAGRRGERLVAGVARDAARSPSAPCNRAAALPPAGSAAPAPSCWSSRSHCRWRC